MSTHQSSTEEYTRWREFLKSRFSTEKKIADLIKYQVATEKSYLALFQNKQYTFDVDSRLTKPQIQKLFETLFGVNIIGMNTHRPPRKKVRTGTSTGYKPAYKRVIFTLKEGQSLQFS
jgi:large subunit ribosomal protein L23